MASAPLRPTIFFRNKSRRVERTERGFEAASPATGVTQRTFAQGLPSRGRRIWRSQEANSCCVNIRMFRPPLFKGKKEKMEKSSAVNPRGTRPAVDYGLLIWNYNFTASLSLFKQLSSLKNVPIWGVDRGASWPKTTCSQINMLVFRIYKILQHR